MALNLVILTIPKIIFEGKTMVREDIFVPHQKVLSKKKKPQKWDKKILITLYL